MLDDLPPPQIVESDLPSNCLWRFTPPKIIKSDLPSNCLYDLPSNHLWRFTPPPKSSSLTYPQIVCTIYPQIVFGDLPLPPKSSSPTYPQIICTIYPQIVFGDLPPPPAPEIAKSDLSSNCLCRFTPIVKCEVFDFFHPFLFFIQTFEQFIQVVIIHCHFLRLL